MSTNELIQRASNGTITSDELSYTAKQLEQGVGDAYTNLLILGRACAKQYRGLVEKFLNYYDDPMLARVALQILCRYWGLAEDYASQITEFVSGVDWDEDEDIRIMAISCSDSIVDSPQHRTLLAKLHSIAIDNKEGELVRQAAYAAMAISCGVKPAELPSPAKFRVDKDMDPKIMNQVELKLAH